MQFVRASLADSLLDLPDGSAGASRPVFLFGCTFSSLQVRSRVSFRGMTPRPLLESFQLYVRPPPAY